MNKYLANFTKKKFFLTILTLIGLLLLLVILSEKTNRVEWIKVSNQSDGYTTIVYKTWLPSRAIIVLEESDGSNFRAKFSIDDRDNNGKFYDFLTRDFRNIHHVSIPELDPNTAYRYRIGITRLRDSGDNLTFSTLETPKNYTTPDPVFSRVLDEDRFPIEDLLIVTSLFNPDGITSSPNTTLTNSDGGWVLDLNNFSNPDGTKFSINDSSKLNIEVYNSLGFSRRKDFSLDNYQPLDYIIFEDNIISDLKNSLGQWRSKDIISSRNNTEFYSNNFVYVDSQNSCAWFGWCDCSRHEDGEVVSCGYDECSMQTAISRGCIEDDEVEEPPTLPPTEEQNDDIPCFSPASSCRQNGVSGTCTTIYPYSCETGSGSSGNRDGCTSSNASCTKDGKAGRCSTSSPFYCIPNQTDQEDEEEETNPNRDGCNSPYASCTKDGKAGRCSTSSPFYCIPNQTDQEDEEEETNPNRDGCNSPYASCTKDGKAGRCSTSSPFYCIPNQADQEDEEEETNPNRDGCNSPGVSCRKNGLDGNCSYSSPFYCEIKIGNSCNSPYVPCSSNGKPGNCSSKPPYDCITEEIPEENNSQSEEAIKNSTSCYYPRQACNAGGKGGSCTTSFPYKCEIYEEPVCNSPGLNCNTKGVPGRCSYTSPFYCIPNPTPEESCKRTGNIWVTDRQVCLSKKEFLSQYPTPKGCLMPDMTLFLDSCPNGSTPISEVLVGVMNENANLDIIGIPPVMIPSPADEDEIFQSTLESFQIEYPWLNKQVVFFDSKESMAQELASRGYPPLQSGCFSADQIYCLRAHIPENPEEASDLFAHELAHQLQMVNGGKKKLSELEGLNCRYAQVDEMGNPVTTDTCTAMTEFGAELTGGNAGGYYFGEDNLPAEEYLSYIYSDLDSKGCVANLTPEDFAEGFSSLETDAIQAVNQAFLDCNLTAASYFKDYGNEYNASNNIIEENILRRISLKLSEGIIALGSNVISKSQIFREQGISSSVYAENEIKSIDKSGVYRLEEEGLGIELSTRRIVKTTVTDESIQRGQIKTFWDKNRDGFKQDDEPYIDSSNQPFKINIEEEAFEYTFRKGLNLVSFPFIPEEFNTASELWNYLHGNFVDVKDIAKYDSGKFIIYSRTRSGEFSGDDFNLIPGEGYIIFTPESQGVVVFRGNNIQDSVLLKMGVGWNLIGIVSDKELTSKSFLRSCRDVDIFCDVLSEYKNGRYNNSVLDEEELFYGEDFVIDRKSGYFVRVGQNSSASEFSP